ncbi:MAG: hypothetical protein ABI321_10230 [Polyangia bacterium]
MSDIAGNPTTLRLLAPRALAGAARIATRLATPPLVQSHAGGALAFSDRMLRRWIASDERPFTTAASPGLGGAPLSTRWEDQAQQVTTPRRIVAQPVVAQAFVQPELASRPAAVELRAIDLVRNVVVRDAFVQQLSSPAHQRRSDATRVAGAPTVVAAVSAALPQAELAVVRAAAPSVSLTQRLVAQLGRADEMLRLTRVAADPARRELSRLAPPIVGGSLFAEPIDGAQVARGQDALTSRAFVAAVTRTDVVNVGTRRPDVTAATPAEARPVGRPMTAAPGVETTVIAPAIAEADTSAARPAAAFVELSQDVANTPLGAAFQAQLVAAARDVEVTRERAFAEAALASARAERGGSKPFDAGITPNAFDASSSFGDTAAAPFSLGAVRLGPPSASGRIAALPGIGVQAELPSSMPTVWPRLQRFIDRLAGPVLLQQTGAVTLDALTSAVSGRASAMSLLDLGTEIPPARASFAAAVTPPRVASFGAPATDPALASDEPARLVRNVPTMTTLVAPLAEPARAHVERPQPNATVARAEPARGGSVAAADATSRGDVPAVAFAESVGVARVDQPSSAITFTGGAESSATLEGELARYELAAGINSGVAAARYMPGRLAQRAELLATLAEQRADRQLGIEPAVAPRSVSWSSDAFTVVSLDPWMSSTVGGAGAARGLGATRDAGATLGLGSSRAASGAMPGSSAAEPELFRRGGFEATFVAPERWTTARGVEHVAPRREAAVPTSYADGASRAAVLGGGVAPGSIASLLAFVDAQLGPRLLEAARPLPVAAPGAVYLSGDVATPGSSGVLSRALVGAANDSSRVAAGTTPVARTLAGLSAGVGAIDAAHHLDGTRAAEFGGGSSLQRDFTRRYVDLAEVAPRPTALDVSSNFSLGAARTGRSPATAESSMASTTATLGHGAIGQLGRRSEQVAGEVGVRVGALASEFLIDVHTDGVPGDQGATLHARDSAQPWLSTSEWILLSLFPSTSVAHEIAASHAVGARSDVPRRLLEGGGRFPLAAVGDLATARGARPGAGGVVNGGLVEDVFDGVSEDLGKPMRSILAERAPGLSALMPSSAMNTNKEQGSPSSPTTAYLPDGRMPRGNRMVARAAMPTVGGAPSSLAYTSEAAERRAASPVGAPLWGHLRPQGRPVVEDAGSPSAGHATSNQSAARAIGGLSSLQGVHHGPRAAALELVAPFIEASRAETTGGAASFNRPASPVVSARAPDQPTKSLVTALSAASSQPSNDRLTMADLTLISIVSATEQVAASSQGATPDIAPVDGRQKPGSTHAAGSGFTTNEDHEVEVVAQRAFDRFMDELRRYTEHKGDTWEK